MHRNPVKRGMVRSPELWRWSSFRYYRLGEEGPVKIGTPSIPPFAGQRVGHPLISKTEMKPEMGGPPAQTTERSTENS
jgi:hypothetical protein